MSLVVDDNGNITIVQGDSGTLVIDGIDTNNNYKVYFAIQDKKRNPIGGEVTVESNGNDTVVISLTGNLTNLLTVPPKQKSETYYYGVKLCLESNAKEDTLIIGNGDIGSLNTITVYPKKVEGI